MLSIVVPAYNEGEHIYENLKTIDKALKAFCSEYEIIAVNDGSKDNTGAEVARAAADIASVWTDLREIVKRCEREKIAVISVKEGNLSEFVKTFGCLFNAISKSREIRIEEDDELPEDC